MTMRTGLLVVTAVLLVCQTLSISKYDFNVCRIKFCADKEAACVADEDACMAAFALTRRCMAECQSADQLETYNKCWAGCKQGAAVGANTLYGQVAQCYESLCYLGGYWGQALGLLLGVLALIMI